MAPDDDAQDVRDDDPLATDPVIEAYKRHVDRALIREQLRRSVDERVHNMIASLRFAEALRAAGRPKDLEAIAELELILEEQRRNRDRE